MINQRAMPVSGCFLKSRAVYFQENLNYLFHLKSKMLIICYQLEKHKKHKEKNIRGRIRGRARSKGRGTGRTKGRGKGQGRGKCRNRARVTWE